MEYGIVDQNIRRCNRNLLITGAFIVLALLGLAAFNARYFYNFFLGPFAVDGPELATTANPAAGAKYFVAIKGDEVIETGFQQVRKRVDKYTREVKSETVTADYVALGVGGRLLLVKSQTGHTGTEFTGALVEVPEDINSRFISEVGRQRQEMRDAFLPVMLDATGFRGPGYWGLGIGVPLVAFGVWSLAKAGKRMANHDAHPIIKSLARFGLPRDVVKTIDEEAKNGAHTTLIGPLTLTPYWLLHATRYRLAILRCDEVIWAYKKVTKHSINFIPTGKTYAVIIRSRDGRSQEITCGQKNADAMIGELARRWPWTLIGYSDDLDAAWKSNRAAIIGAVDARFQQAG
jgi:uncharacterized protein DUF6709